MKLKLKSVLTGAVVLVVAATSFVIKPIQAAPGQPLLAQATTQPGQGRWANLNLTPEQQTRLRQLHEQTRKKIEAVFTPQQLQQYRTALQNRRSGMRTANGDVNSSSAQQTGRQNILATLNLTQEQKTKIQQLLRDSRNQRNTILTDAQRSQLQQNWQAQMNNSAH